MFTGIVDHCGTITNLEKTEGGVRLAIATTFKDLKEGESISVDGACLTVVRPRDGVFFCELSPETLNVTSAKGYEKNSQVNLERALCLGDRMGGHWVTGHVDTTAFVESSSASAEFWKLNIAGLSSDQMRFIHRKGSIAIQGVSLTINDVAAKGFSVMLIPHTLKLTNLDQLKPQSLVNLEFDWMVKVVLNEAQRLSVLSR